MKIFTTLAIAGALFLITATSALASHGATQVAAPVPSHGSVWFGDGLDRYNIASVPSHGSVWFGSGLGRYDTLVIPVPVHGSIAFGAGIGH